MNEFEVAEPDPTPEQLEAISFGLVTLYGLIGKILSALPIPIGLPMASEMEGAEMAKALQEARVALNDLPMDQFTKMVIDKAILEWVTANDLLLLACAYGQERWRMSAIAYTISRLIVLLESADRRLANQ